MESLKMMHPHLAKISNKDYLLLKNKVEDYFTDLFSRVGWDSFSSWVPRVGGVGGTSEEKVPPKPRVKTMREIIYFIFKEHEVLFFKTSIMQRILDVTIQKMFREKK